MKECGMRNAECGMRRSPKGSRPERRPRLVVPSRMGPLAFALPTSDFRLPTSHPRSALTLAELLIVLAILAMIGGLVLPAAGRYVSETRETTTRYSLTRLRDVIAEVYWQDSGRLPRPSKVTSERLDHPQLRYLFINPATETAAVDFDRDYARGWRGPYLVHRDGALYTVSSNSTIGFTSRYGLTGDPTVLDGWGRPIVVQDPPLPTASGLRDVRLVSAGPDGIVQIDPTVATSALTTANTGDDVWLSFEVR